jgi:hypothetical protein
LFPRSEAVIVSPGLRQLLFHFVMIKPTHYDDDGYPIQWFRSAIPSNTLACLNALAEDARGRNVLGPDVEIRLHTYDETNRRVQPDRIIREIRKAGGKALIGLVGVQSNQFPRAVDHARPFLAAGLPVCIGGFHISGCIAMLPEMPQDMRETQALGISFFAGEAEEGRFDEVLRDAWNGMLAPLYNHMDKLPNLQGEPPPILPRKHIRRTSGSLSSMDLGRGCPYQCSFCTIINVQGRKSRFRSPDDLEKIVRENCAQSIRRFFITDDNFARNRDWELLFATDRVARRRLPEDRLHHPGRHRSATRSRISSRRPRRQASAGCSSDWRTSIRTISSQPRNARTRSPTTGRCCRNGASTAPSPVPATSSPGFALAELFRLEQQSFQLRPPAKGLCGFAGLLFRRCGIETAQDQIPRHRPAADISPQETGRVIERSNEDDRRSGKL